MLTLVSLVVLTRALDELSLLRATNDSVRAMEVRTSLCRSIIRVESMLENSQGTEIPKSDHTSSRGLPEQ